jgi:hypothetical protein
MKLSRTIKRDDNNDIASIGITFTERTFRNQYDNSSSLTIPKEFVEELQIENSKVSISIMMILMVVSIY